MLIPKTDRPLIITCDYRSGTGYATCTRGFLKIFNQGGIPFRLLPEPELFKRCTTEIEDQFFDYYILKEEERHYIADDNYVYFRLYPPRENAKRLFNIGYTMVEGYTVNPYHTNLIDNSFDLVIVPSHFVKNVLSQYMNSDKIEVCPPGVDIKFFNVQNIKNKPEGIKFKKIDFELKKIVDTDEEPHGFKFSSNARFCHRKGVDLVLESYVKGFKNNDDDVSLVLFWLPENPFEPQRMENRIFEILDEIGATSNSRCPDIYIYDEPWSTEIQYLPYVWSDCFVFPSRGEGFGLPVLEAGACGVPVICPNHSGLSDFVNYKNAFVIDVDQIDDIGDLDKQYDLTTYRGNHSEWARDMFHHQTKRCLFPIMKSKRVLDQIIDYMKYVYDNSISMTTCQKIQNMYETSLEYSWLRKPKDGIYRIFGDLSK